MRDTIKNIIKSAPGQRLTVEAELYNDWLGGWVPERVDLSIGPRGGLVVAADGFDPLKGLPARMRQRTLENILAAIAAASRKHEAL